MAVHATELAAGFRAQPLTERCRRIWQRGDHALIGVSTGNSYFSTERLTELVCWAQHHFRAVDVICADTHIDTMLIAEGCDPEEAARRARRRVVNVRRRIRHALRCSSHEHGATSAHMLSEFQQSSAYRHVRAQVEDALHNHPPFARACRNMVRSFLPEDTEEEGDREPGPRMRAGLAYVANELPFVIDTPRILGVPSSLSCYHVLPPAVEELFQRPGGLTPAARQGFAVVTPPPRPSAEVGNRP